MKQKGFTPTPKKIKAPIFFGVSSRSGRGFTLIEIMTALSIFLVVMTVSMGSIMGIFDANRKSRSIKSVMLNFNIALETMSREIRFGKNYHCETGTSGNQLNQPKDCPNLTTGGDLMSFLSFEGDQVVYRFIDGAIEKSTNGGQSYSTITSPEVMIENVSFYVVGAGVAPTNLLQPKVFILIKGKAGTTGKQETEFSLQTLISQRYLDKP